MKNINKLLGTLVLSATSLFSNGQLTESDSIALNNINKINPVENSFPQVEFPQERYKMTQDPSFYPAIVLAGTVAFNVIYSNNHLAMDERARLTKTTTGVYIAGGLISVGTYFISKKIIEKRKEKKLAKYLNF